MREPGWYFVQVSFSDDVEQAYWDGGYWEIAGIDWTISDDSLCYIGPKIEQPKEQSDGSSN